MVILGLGLDGLDALEACACKETCTGGDCLLIFAVFELIVGWDDLDLCEEEEG